MVTRRLEMQWCLYSLNMTLLWRALYSDGSVDGIWSPRTYVLYPPHRFEQCTSNAIITDIRKGTLLFIIITKISFGVKVHISYKSSCGCKDISISLLSNYISFAHLMQNKQTTSNYQTCTFTVDCLLRTEIIC